MEELVLDSAAIAAKLILELHARQPEHPTFDQVGLLDGASIVANFVTYGELGCALHHVLYMVHESAIDFPKERVDRLHRLATQIGERNHYSKENLEALSFEQRSSVYNAL
jgi:hypothetical protein